MNRFDIPPFYVLHVARSATVLLIPPYLMVCTIFRTLHTNSSKFQNIFKAVQGVISSSTQERSSDGNALHNNATSSIRQL